MRKKLTKTLDAFDRMLVVMEKLRHPKTGCPWDLNQTHETLLRYLFEEANEFKQAVVKKDEINIEEELGDILLQVLFHAQIAAEEKRFTIRDVIETLIQKLTLRHPHVFGYQKEHHTILKGASLRTEKEVLANWSALKKMSNAAMHKRVLRRKKR